MQTRTPLLLCAAGLAVVLPLALLVLGGPTLAEGEGPGLASRSMDRAPASGVVADSAAVDRLRDARDLGRVDPILAADPAAAAPGAGELVTVEVVRAGTREPVPQAQVWQWPKSPASGGDGIAAWFHEGLAEEHLQESAAQRTDSQGRARVPPAEDGFWLVASADGLWGYANFAGGITEPAVVTLAADVDLRVLVVDEDGAPVIGAPLALRLRRGPAAFDLLTARTEPPDGMARLRHAGHFLRSADGEAVVVALQGLLDPPLERRIAPDQPADEPLRLVLGPTGSCEVTVVDASGQRVDGALEATLRFADVGDRAETIRSRSGEAVVFEHVALGRMLGLSVIREGSEGTLEAWGPGPRADGERVRLSVQLQGDAVILRGRLVDGAGAPLGGLSAQASVEAGTPGPGTEEARPLNVAADGRFSVDVAPWAGPGGPQALAVYQLSDAGAELAVARRPLPPVRTAGSLDLGDFVLLESPLAVAGVVVDGHGEPVEGATVSHILVQIGTAPGGEAVARGPGLTAARTDATGNFRILGDPGSELISLQARKGSLAAGPVIASVGERAVRLVLGATGGIAGTVLLDPSLKDATILVQAARADARAEAGDEPEPRASVLDREGRFSLRNLRPGRYRVAVTYAATGSELGAVGDVVIPAGEPARDPRLEPLDLRTAGWLIELELVDESGAPVASGRAFGRPSGDAEARWLFASQDDGKLALLAAGDPLDISIAAPGFLQATLDRVTASQRVVLRRAATLRFRLARGLRPPEPPFELGLLLTPVDADRIGGFTDSTLVRFDEDGALTCSTAFTGELRVELAVLEHGGSSSAPSYVRDDAPRVISVADLPFEQTFEIRFDPDRLSAAERDLREEP